MNKFANGEFPKMNFNVFVILMCVMTVHSLMNELRVLNLCILNYYDANDFSVMIIQLILNKS